MTDHFNSYCRLSHELTQADKRRRQHERHELRCLLWTVGIAAAAVFGPFLAVWLYSLVA